MCAEFLIDTAVTWEMVENVLQETFKTSSTFGKNKSAAQIGEGEGFMSKLALLNLDWSVNDLNLPSSVVVKITGSVEAQELAKGVFDDNTTTFELSSRKLHNAEMCFYENISPSRSLLKYYGGLKFSEENNTGFFLMEYVPGCIHQSFHRLKVEQIEEVLEKLVTISAEYIRNPEKFSELKTTRDVLFGLRKEYLTLESLQGCLREMAQKIPDAEEEINLFSNELEVLLDFDKMKEMESLDGNNILCQGDLWAGNVLWREFDGTLNPIKIIDWQSAQIASPAVDLIKLLTSNLSADVRIAKTDHILEFYYDKLKSEFSDVPFTLQQLKESYEKAFPTQILLDIGFFPGMLEMYTKNCDADEAEERSNIIKDMFRGILKSGLEYCRKHY